MRLPATFLLLAAVALAQDALPERAVARIGEARFFHPSGIVGGAWSPDGKRVLLISEAGEVRVWDAATGALLWKAESEAEGGCGAAFDATGEGVVRVLRAAPPADGPQELLVDRFDAATGGTPQKSPLDLRGVEPTLLAQAPGAVAVVGERGEVMVFDLATRTLRWARSSRAADLEALALAPDGVHVAVGGDQGMDLLGKDGRVEWEVSGGDASIVAVAFSADGALVAAGDEDGRMRVLDVATGALRAEFSAGENSIGRIAFSPDGRNLLTSDSGNEVHLSEIASAKATWSSSLTDDVSGFVGFSPDGAVVVIGAASGLARFFDAATGAARASGDGLGEPVTAIALSADGSCLLAAGEGGRVAEWEVGSKAVRWQERASGGAIAAAVLGSDGKATTISDDGVWRRHPGADPGPARDDEGDSGRATVIAALRADGAVLATAGAGIVRVRHRGDETAGTDIPIPELRRPATVAFSLDGSLLAVAATNGDIVVLDVASGAQAASIVAFDAEQDTPVQIAFSPDGRSLATTAWGRPIVWELASGSAVRVLDLTKLSSPALAFSPDGRTIALGGMGGDVELYDFATGKLMQRLEGPLGGVTCLAFSADGRRLAAGSADTTAWVWDVAGLVPALERDAKADLAACWERLSGSDGAEAAGPTWALVAVGDEAVAFLAKRLEPAVVDAAMIADLVRRLDADEFEAREAAEAALADLGPDAVLALREALARSPSAEVRGRAARLLEVVGGLKLTSGASLRQARAVGVLERIGTPAAREALRRLAGGAPGARLTRDAKASLARLR